MKNLTLSYDLPNSWVHKAGLQKVQVFFSGENLLTFTKLKGMFDPEAILVPTHIQVREERTIR